MIYKKFRSQYKHLFQKEVFAFGHEEMCLHNFSTHCQPCQFLVSSMSVHRIFSCFFQQSLEHFMKKSSLSLFFLFRRRVMFLTKKFWPIKSVIIITTQPIVLLLGCGSYFGVYFSSTIINLRKRHILLRKPTFSEKAILSDKKNLATVSLFGQIQSSVVSYSQSFKYSQ